METYIEPKELIDNPDFQKQRNKYLSSLKDVKIDNPIIGIINAFNRIQYCFTLQSCYGHFVYSGQDDPHNLDPLPITNEISTVEYRIAYVALCVEYSKSGKALIEDLSKITLIDPGNIQFCSAEWFWKRQVNSYALQVEPDRFKNKDKALLDYQEAIRIENSRNKFFDQLRILLRKHGKLQ
jgi:hypothetical protein